MDSNIGKCFRHQTCTAKEHDPAVRADKWRAHQTHDNENMDKILAKYVITGHHVSHRHANQQGGAGGHTGYEQASAQCRVIIFFRKETDIIFQGKLFRFR